MITNEQVKHIASLAKLKFTEEELDGFTKKFSQVLFYVEKLDEVDTENIAPTFQVNDNIKEFREDIVIEGLSRDEVLQNTVEKQYGYFKLLNIME